MLGGIDLSMITERFMSKSATLRPLQCNTLTMESANIWPDTPNLRPEAQGSLGVGRPGGKIGYGEP